jgi:hypothetical protein
MELVRLTTSLAHLSEVATVVSAQTGPLVIACTDANSVMAAATLRGQLDRPVGVWLDLSADYSAALAARDVATLSWLIDLEHVVVSAEHDAPSHADVVEALLTNDEVNFANDVAVIVKAYNRPAPPKPIIVWSYDGKTLHRKDITLIESSGAHFADVSLTTFA